MTTRSIVRKGDIVQALGTLGVKGGDLLQVHSSMKSFGWVEGGPEAVIDALLEIVGAEGTVMMPTFNHGAAFIFDIKTTPSRNGLLTEALRQRPDARRSMHPTHPYAAVGKEAEWLTQGHLKAGTFGVDSPLGKLAQKGGYCLMLGVGFDRCTAAHIGECKAQARCIGWWRHTRRILLEDGSVVQVMGDLWRNGPCRIEWEPLERRMRASGLVRDGRIGDAHSMLFRAMDAVQTAYEMTFELCPECPTMPRADG